MPRTMYIEVEEVTQDILGRKRNITTPLFEEDLDPVFSEMVEIMVGNVKNKKIEGLKEVLEFSPSIFYDEYRIYGDLLKLIVKEIDIKFPLSHTIQDDLIYNVRFEANLETIKGIC